MKSFLKRLSIFILIPFLIVLVGYLYFDPYKVIYEYDDYGKSCVVLNRDYVSTTKYLKNKDKYHFDSFIFGSSRTIAFKAKTWKEYLGNEASPFVFDGAGESIYGIHGKLKYLDKQNVTINNVLIVLCRDWMAIDRGLYSGHIFKKHPATSDETWLNFHFTMFSAYLNTKFLLAYYDFTFTGVFRPSMKTVLTQDQLTIDPISNDITVPLIDAKIAENPKQHILNNAALFYDRKGEKLDSIDRLDPENIQMLKEIKQILEKRNVNYKIVASPSYDQIKFSTNDENILQDLFGNHFYDYTGKNKFTDNKENYYETSHYRPTIGKLMLDEMYSKEKDK